VQGRACLFLMREEYTQARDVLEQALREEASADLRSRAVTRLLGGYALRESGDTAGARRVVTTALDTLRAVGDAAGEAAALGALGDLAARAGIGLTAESLYRRGLDRLGAAPAPRRSRPRPAGPGGALGTRGGRSEGGAGAPRGATGLARGGRRAPPRQ